MGKSLEEWNLNDFGLVDNTQFNGYEVFVTGENKILRIYGGGKNAPYFSEGMNYH